MAFPLLTGLILLIAYSLMALYMKMTLKDEMVMLLWLYLMIGVPIFISYFLLVVLYFKANRKWFWTVLCALLLGPSRTLNETVMNALNHGFI